MTTTTAGRPVARPIPRAVKPADRSSRRTCRRCPGRRPGPGPGASTASPGTPRRRSPRPAPTRRPGWRRRRPGGRHRRCRRHGRSVRSRRAPWPDTDRRPSRRRRRAPCTPNAGAAARPGAGPRLHPDRPGVGRMDDDLAADHQRGGRSTCPATAGSARWPPTSAGGAALLGAAGGRRPTTSATRWGPGSASTWRSPAPTWSAAWSSSRGRPASRTTAERAGAPAADEALADSSTRSDGGPPQDTVAGLRRRWLAEPDVRRPARGGQRVRRAAAQHAAGSGLEPPPGRDRHPGAAVGPAGRAAHAGAGRHREPDDASSPRWAAPGWPGHRPDATHAVVPGAGHAPHLQHPADVAAAGAAVPRRPGRS